MKSTAATSTLPYVHTSELYVFFFNLEHLFCLNWGWACVCFLQKEERILPCLLLQERRPDVRICHHFPLSLLQRESRSLSLSHFSVWTWRESGQCTDSLIPCAQEPGKVLPNCPSDTSLAACMKEKLEIKFTLCSQQELILIKCPGQTQ